MGYDVHSHIIKISFLRRLQDTFQKELSELIELYLQDARRKIANLHKAFEEQNLPNLTAAARELRYRSVDVGAIQFSHACLSLEIAAQELRLETIPRLISSVENKFITIRQELNRLKSITFGKIKS